MTKTEDKEKGGLILALDIDNKEPIFWGKPTYKPWWVQLEALVATAYAYKHTGEEYIVVILWKWKIMNSLFNTIYSESKSYSESKFYYRLYIR